MELQNDPKICEVTPTSKMFYILCLLSLCIQCGHGKSLSQENLKIQDQSVSNNKAVIYVEIPSWENRTGYPRFLIYRDHFRRRLDGDSKNADSLPLPLTSYSKPNGKNDENSSSAIISASYSHDSSSSGESNTSDNENDFSSSLEKLLAEREQKPIQPSSLTVNANRNGNDGSVSEPNLNDFMTMSSPQEDKQVINFPKDKTNPCNRLQINPDDAEVETDKRSENGGSGESLEIGNRQNFPERSSIEDHQQQQIDESVEVEAIKDAVPTVDLTMKIIEQSKWNDENVIFSPLSIANVLSMLLLGAGGETFKELSMQLDKHKSLSESSEWSIERYHVAFKKLLMYLRKYSGTGVLLNSASEVFVDKRFPVYPKYQKELLSYYEAPLESFDFGKEGYIFVDRVNKWVREKTHNQIKTILEEPPSDSTTMGIINAIHFKGAWEVPFSDKITRLRDFRVHPKEKVKALMMLNILTIPYIERATYRMTAVPYKDNRTALFLILPKGNDGINDLKNVEKSLTRQELNESIALMNDTKLALTLPKLKFSSDGEMKTILENMGLSTLFKQANFSGISEEGLYISRILHRAAVEINEKGTEASAVTLGTADRIIDDPPIPFGCDKPFLFFIYHVKADTILFWGRVIRPDSKQLT